MLLAMMVMPPLPKATPLNVEVPLVPFGFKNLEDCQDLTAADVDVVREGRCYWGYRGY